MMKLNLIALFGLTLPCSLAVLVCDNGVERQVPSRQVSTFLQQNPGATSDFCYTLICVNGRKTKRIKQRFLQRNLERSNVVAGECVCRTDERRCRNGTILRRSPEQRCRFPQCPRTGCPKQRRTCPDGKTRVRRNIDNFCEFFPCPEEDPLAGPRRAVGRLDIDNFKSYTATLSSFGDRTQGSPSYNRGEDWVRDQLESYGYDVQEHVYRYRGSSRRNLYVTKVGRSRPDQMYIVSAHLDGRGGGGGANDDGSGCSLVLEIARVLAARDTQLETSIRLIFWNNEETGLQGAEAYVDDRRSGQGEESPRGSGRYPEPTWLGVVTHDQILFDHGFPDVQETQSPSADADIEYQARSRQARGSRDLAESLRAGNGNYARDYPAEVSDDMCCTDSVPFEDYCPSVSIRENRRRAEIGRGAQPNWHQPSDVFRTYSELDFLFGFNIVQTTMGTIGQLAGLSVE